MSLSRVMVLTRIVSFLQFFADVSKKSKVITIFVYASESTGFALWENDIGFYAVT